MCEGVITYRSGRVGLRDDQVITGILEVEGGGWYSGCSGGGMGCGQFVVVNMAYSA